MIGVVCITGASGFIGRQLVEELVYAGCKVRALSREALASSSDRVTYFVGHILSDEGTLSDFLNGADVLIHCAGVIRDRKQVFPVNVNGTRHLIKLAQGRVRRWVQLSSIGVYGGFEQGCVDESTELNPGNPYERSKAIADQLLIEAAAKGAFELTILRPSNVYGLGAKSAYLDKLIRLITNRNFFFIGPPGANVTFVHVNDVARALRLCAEMPIAAGRIYNLSGNNTFEFLIDCLARAHGLSAPNRRLPLTLAKLIAQTFGRIPGFPLTLTRFRSMTTRVRYDSNRIEVELGYAPSVDLESGIAQLYERKRGWRR